MKIMGISGYLNTEPYKFIVEMTATELNHLVNNSNAHRRASIGSEVRVDKMYDKLKWLDGNARSIESVVKQLRDAADMLEPINTFTKFFCEGGK